MAILQTLVVNFQWSKCLQKHFFGRACQLSHPSGQYHDQQAPGKRLRGESGIWARRTKGLLDSRNARD